MNIICCRFFFDLNTLIKDNYCFEGMLDGRKYIVHVNRRNVTNAMSFNGEQQCLRSIKKGKRVEFIVGNDIGNEKIVQEIFIGEEDSFEYGFFSHNIINIFQVFFEVDEIDLSSSLLNDELIQNGENIITNFIDIYRYSTMIGEISSSKYLFSPLVEISICKNKLLSQFDENCNFEQLTYQIRNKPVFGAFDEVAIDDSKLEVFNYFLINDKKILTYEKFIMESREQALVKMDFCMSIVLIETAFETFLKQILTKYCESNNIKQLKSAFKPYRDINYIKAISKYNVKIIFCMIFFLIYLM